MHRRIAALALCLLTIARPALAQPAPDSRDHIDAEHHWRLRIPEGWMIGEQAALDHANAIAARLAGQSPPKFMYVLLLVPESGDSGAYILIQKTTLTALPTSFEDIEEAYRSKRLDDIPAAVKEKLPDLVSDLRLDRPVVDRERNRVVVGGTSSNADGATVRSVCVGYFGRDVKMHVNCYAPEAEFDGALPAFTQAIDGFRFEPGFQFVPDPSRTGWRRYLPNSAVAGAVGGVLGVTLLNLWKKRRSKKDASDDASTTDAA